ncbi:MAG: hypothetical protein KC561_09915, partial [Myxococcales bacterium]|nr:hypothetical protein [Myxococcales bacterium]
LSDLAFRRQFVLGPMACFGEHGWKSHTIGSDCVVSHHPALQVSRGQHDSSDVVVLGRIYDPGQPELGPDELATSLAAAANNDVALRKAVFPLVGRFALVANMDGRIKVLHDALGLRTLYYCQVEDQAWCASQPPLLAEVAGLELDTDSEMLRFSRSEHFLRRESAWIGRRTLHRDCHHLPPNHWLDWPSLSVERFYPYQPLGPGKLDQVIPEVARILRATMKAFRSRDELLIALTGGVDSRLIAAACQGLDGIDFYIDRMGKLEPHHTDLVIGGKVAEILQRPYEIRNSLDLPTEIAETMRANVMLPRSLPKHRLIEGHRQATGGRLPINGNGAEVFRSFYDKRGRVSEKSVTGSWLAARQGYAGDKFAEEQAGKVIRALKPAARFGFHLLDLAYWEDRMGNWGTLFAAEQDVVTDEITPFSNRQLIEMMLSTPRRYRLAPKMKAFKALLDELHPGLAHLPWNPSGPSKMVWQLRGRLAGIQASLAGDKSRGGH